MRVCFIYLLALAVFTCCDSHPYNHCSVSDVAKNVTACAVQVANKIYTAFAIKEDGSQGKNLQLTPDYFHCSPGDPKELPPYTDRTVGYIAYDRNTAGYGNDLVIALQGGATPSYEPGGDLNRLSTAEVLCTKCVDHYMVPTVSAVWDTQRNRWVSAVYVNGEVQLATSPDLKVWTPNTWLQGKLENLTELFVILPSDSVTGNKECQWVLVFKDTDENDVTTLRYTFFVPDDADQAVVDKGVLDWCPDWKDITVITSNSSDQTEINFIGVVGVDYLQYGVYLQNVLLTRTFRYSSAGQLTQSFAKPVLENAGLKYIRLTDLAFNPTDDPFQCYQSLSYRLLAEFDVGPSEFGFEIYANPLDRRNYGADLTVFRAFSFVQSNRYHWLPNDQSVRIADDPKGQINVPYTAIGKVKLHIFADEALVEFFIDDGVVAGSIFTFPDLSWNRFHLYSNKRVNIPNLELTIYDDLKPEIIY